MKFLSQHCDAMLLTMVFFGGWSASEVKTKGFLKSKSLGFEFGRMGGFAKVDNRFGYEKWLQGGPLG